MPNLSAWTESGSSISLVAATQPVSTASSPVDVDYLTNADKIALIAQYSTELATKTSLDTTAAALSLSSVSYDNAVAGISTTLASASAPSNWATLWPDGTTFGPVVGIQTLLANAWAVVASNRVALQGAISAAQAAVAQANATAAAATDATTKMEAAISIAAPIVVATLPTLPSTSYPSGKVVFNSADGLLYQSSGSAWTALAVAGANIVANSITAGQIAAGAIGATQIAAGAITTAALTVCDWTNLCYNPGFESGDTQWSGGTISTAYFHSGLASMEFANGSGAISVSNGNVVPGVAPGQTFIWQVWAYTPGTLTSGTLGIWIQWISAANITISYSEMSVTPTSTWTQFSNTAVAPAGTVAARVFLLGQSPVGASIYVDDCYFRRCDDASLIVDGAITASKISTGAINASMITAGVLTASYIYFTDGFCLNTLEPAEAGSNVTSGHVLTAKVSTSSVWSGNGTSAIQAVTGMGFTVAAAGTSDYYNIWGMLPANGTASAPYDIYVCVDGVTTTKYGFGYCQGGVSAGEGVFFASITGLSEGAHTLQMYVIPTTTSYGISIAGNCYAICQRVY